MSMKALNLNLEENRALNKLKHDLESWRDLILMTSSVLKWEKKFYAAIVFGIVSFIYLILWLLDLSTLTLVSLLALIVVAFDVIYPIISKIFIKNDKWSGKHEKKFEEVCLEICLVKYKLQSLHGVVFTPREQRSTMFVIAFGILLVILAWIGAVIDNLLLCYLGTLCVALYPGLQQHGIVGTKNIFGSILKAKLQQVKCNGKSE